jgi:hypothetical protein
MFHVWNRKHSVVKNVSGAHLNMSFGWIPLFKDLKGLWTGLQKLSGRLRWLRRNAGKQLTNRLTWPIQSTSSEVVTLDGGLNASVVGAGVTVPGYSYQRIRKVTLVEHYHATLRYSYTMDEMSELELKIKGFLEALGIRWDLAILWNALPLSFVVDWVLDVSSFLRSFSVDNLGLKTNIIDFCHSVKSTAVTEHCVRFYNNLAPTVDTFIPRWTAVCGTKTRYERERAMPSLHALDNTGLNLREVVLSAALVGANARSRNRRRKRTRSPRRDVAFNDPW